MTKTMNEAETRTELNTLSRSLAAVHRSLLEFQKEIHEGLEEKRLGPYEVLKLSLEHPDFAWLRKISGLIVQIDEKVDDKESKNLEDFRQVMIAEIKDFFLNPAGDQVTRSRLQLAFSRDPGLYALLAKLKSHLN